VREDAAVFRHQRKAHAGAFVRRKGGQVFAVELDAAAGARAGVNHAFQQGRLAGAVAAEQGHALARGDRKARAVQDVAVAVEGVELLDLKH